LIWEGHVTCMGENRTADILVGKPWCICDNNKSCLKTTWEVVDWIFLAGDRYEGLLL
jgi:hypothetical protein